MQRREPFFVCYPVERGNSSNTGLSTNISEPVSFTLGMVTDNQTVEFNTCLTDLDPLSWLQLCCKSKNLRAHFLADFLVSVDEISMVLQHVFCCYCCFYWHSFQFYSAGLLTRDRTLNSYSVEIHISFNQYSWKRTLPMQFKRTISKNLTLAYVWILMNPFLSNLVCW